MGLGHEAAIFYAMLVQQTVTISYATMLTWSAEFNVDVTWKEWDRICENIKRVSRDIQIRLIQFKIVNHFYWTPTRIFRLKLTNIMVGKQIMRNWKNPGEPSFQESSTELAKRIIRKNPFQH